MKYDLLELLRLEIYTPQTNTWTDIAPSTISIDVGRAELEPGQLAVEVRDPALDPSSDDLIRPGRHVRLVTIDGDVVTTGWIDPDSIDVQYEPLLSDPKKRTKITFGVLDSLTTLAKAIRPEGVATVAQLAYVLQGLGVTYTLNGATPAPGTPPVVSYNSAATALDQVVITRDTVRGYAFIDRLGVLRVYDRTSRPSDVKATFAEASYNMDFASGYDPRTCINSVEVVVLRVVATSGAVEEERHGPFTDFDSIDENGLHAAAYTVHGDGWNETTIAAYAAAVLADNAVPRRRARSVTLAIQTLEDLPKALLDLQDLVQVQNERAAIDEYARITSIQHRITPSGWLVTLGFAGESSSAAPVSTTAPTGVIGGVVNDIDDIVTGIDDILAQLNEDLGTLNTVTLPELQADLAENATALDTLNTVTLPALASELAELDGAFPVTSTSIADNAITTPKLVTNAVTTDKITANAVNANKIAANSINAGHIQANSIGADKIVANSIGADQIAANSIGADKIIANSIGADEIAANAIDGKTITGVTVLSGLFKTSGGSRRVELDDGTGGGEVRYLHPLAQTPGRLVQLDIATLYLALESATRSGATAQGKVRVSPGASAGLVELMGTVTADGAMTVAGGFSAAGLKIPAPTTTAAAANAYFDSAGNLLKSTSSKRYKADVQPLDLDVATVLALEPKTYDSLVDDTDDRFVGFIAEDAERLGLEQWVVRDAEGRVDGFAYAAWPVAQQLVLREQQARITALEQTVADLAHRLDTITREGTS